jgi:hypothetical protein
MACGAAAASLTLASAESVDHGITMARVLDLAARVRNPEKEPLPLRPHAIDCIHEYDSVFLVSPDIKKTIEAGALSWPSNRPSSPMACPIRKT